MIATDQLRSGRHFMCVTPTNSSLSHAGSRCTFGCRCVVTEHLAGWQFVTTLPQLAMRMQLRCAGGHVHVQRTPGQQMPTRMRRTIVTSIRQTRDRLETAQSVAAVDGRPHSSTQTSLSRLRVNLGHPKNNVLIRHLQHATRDATNFGTSPKLRMSCVRSC